MEKVTYSGSQVQIERFLLGVYTFYTLTLVLISGKQEWGRINDLLWFCCLLFAWGIHLSVYKSYSFRIKLFAIFMQITVVLYAIHSEGFQDVIPTFMVFVVLLSLSGVPDVIFITILSILIIFGYHFYKVYIIQGCVYSNLAIEISQLMNVFLLQFVVYSWIKRTNEGSRSLMKVIEELKVVQQSKDDFVANVSHEIRTPINTICGMSELVLQEELPYKVKENVKNMQIAGRNLMGVVSDILDYSELQSEQIELEEEAYNITSTINDVINMTMAKKNEKKIELIVDCNANIPSVLMGDEKKLRRVIMNLMDNAIKFTETGGVCLGISYRKESYGINLIVSVKDTGIGMDEISLEKLFHSFTQVDTSRKRQEGGLGLGLAISHALIDKMGGAITVKSKLGKGTCVKVVIPQKIVDETPIAILENLGSENVATYINMEQFANPEIRDEYTSMVFHMVEQLRGKCHVCRNLAELQRRYEKESFTHIFISAVEYKENPTYFDEIAQKTNVVVILDHEQERLINSLSLLKIYKPFYILTIVSILNGIYDRGKREKISQQKFITKDAHVLVVDDNQMNLLVAEELLSNYRIKVTRATSGKEALNKIVSADYDFVFMDHMMPEMDGVETLQRIRHMLGTYYQKVPIVALTANAVAGTREMLLSEGFNDFLEKPIERSVLERVLIRNLAPDKIVYEDELEKVAAVENNCELDIEDLDVEKGILYCNGKEQYLKILRAYCEDWSKTGDLADRLFEERDWKNYTITVHGMKSALRSIGASHLSEQARLLEYAGKEGRIDFILQNHNNLMKAYIELFDRLRQNPVICPADKIGEEPKEVINSNTLSVISTDALERIIEQMEDVMYSLDGERLLELISELEKYQYKGQIMKDVLVPIRRKVEMYDYISAVESIMRWKNELTK